MAVFEERTSNPKRRDVMVEDIAPNIRYVHTHNYRAVTISIPWDERVEFQNWFQCNGLKPNSGWESPYYGSDPLDLSGATHPAVKPYIFIGLTKAEVMMLKLAWSRTG
jgi:hypothetical protein